GNVCYRQSHQGRRRSGRAGHEPGARHSRNLGSDCSRTDAMLTHPTITPALLPVYATFPLRAVSGHGSWLVDEQGDEWLDVYGGHAVATCGHSHPDVVKAIADQAAKLLFYSTAVPHAGREDLADAIVARSPSPLGK